MTWVSRVELASPGSGARGVPGNAELRKVSPGGSWVRIASPGSPGFESRGTGVQLLSLLLQPGSGSSSCKHWGELRDGMWPGTSELDRPGEGAVTRLGWLLGVLEPGFRGPGAPES